MIRRYVRYFSGIPFVRDIVTMQVGRVVYMGLTLLSSIAFARILGLEGYGTYAVILAFVSTVRTFTNLGQSSALQVFFAEQYGTGNRQGMAGVLKNFLQMSALNGIILLTLAAIAPWLSFRLYGNPLIGGYARILFLYNAIDVFNSGVIITMQAIRQVRMKTVLEQGENALFLVIAVIALSGGFGVAGVIWGQLLTSLLFLPLSFLAYRRAARRFNLPGLRDILGAPQHAARQYRSQGLWFSVDKNIGGLYPSGLFFVLSLVAPVSTVGVTRLALQLASMPQSLLLPQVNELSTTVLANMASQGRATLRRNAAKVIKHALAFHAVVSLAALVAIPVFIPLLYGMKYLQAIPLALWLVILSLPLPLTIVNSPLLRLFRKVPLSLLTTTVTLITMWTSVLTLTRFIGAERSFLLAYFIGIVTPLFLTAYLFKLLLAQEHA